MKRFKKIILSVLLLLIIGSVFYVSTYYPASETAKTIITEKVRKDACILGQTDSKRALIFYPGGKVEAEAYLPLLEKIAEKGYLCILVKMPFNLAVLNPDAADGLKMMYPDIEEWYIGGHSLGGAMAASYVYDHQNDFNGLVLLGAYSTKNLNQSDLDVYSFLGSNDQILNRKSYEKYRSHLPSDSKEILIEGGNHSQFGDYGFQKGDGTALIDRVSQWDIIADALSYE